MKRMELLSPLFYMRDRLIDSFFPIPCPHAGCISADVVELDGILDKSIDANPSVISFPSVPSLSSYLV